MLRARLERYTGQSYILSSMEEIGYKPKKGRCAGVAQMGVQAFLADDLDTFNERVIHIHDTWKKIEALKKDKTIVNLAANPAYQTLLNDLRRIDCLAFFDGVELYQEPTLYTELLGKHTSQFKPAEVSTITINSKLSSQGGLHQVQHFLTYYSVDELTKLFALIQDNAGKEKIAMTFSSNNHRISVCYDGRFNKWILIDANQLPAHEVTMKDLAERVFSAYTFNNEKFDATAISTRFYSTGASQDTIAKVLSKLKKDPEFQQLQTITPEKARRTTKKQANLLHLAATYGEPASTGSILDLMEIDPNDKNEEQETALFISADHGHFRTAKKLLSTKSTKVDIADKNGETPVLVAAKNGDKKMVRLLLEHNADPHHVSNDKFSAVTIAASKKHLSILKLFSLYDVDLFKPDGTGKTALDHAKENKFQEIIDYLEAKQLAASARLTTPSPSTLGKHSVFATASTDPKESAPAEQPFKKKQKASRI